MSKSEKYELKSVEPKKKKYGSLDQGVSSSMTHILPNDSLEQELEDGAATERTLLLPRQRDGSFTDFLQTLQKVPVLPDRSRAVSFDPATFTTPEAVRRTTAAAYSQSASFDDAVSPRWSETRPLLAPPSITPSITQRRSQLASSSFHDRRQSQAPWILDTGDAREPQQESAGGLQATLKSWLCGSSSVQREESADDFARFAFDPASCVDPEAVLRGAAREHERQKTLASPLDVRQRPSKGAGDPQNHNNEYNLERRKGAQLPAELDSCFFRDGRRRIDYILVYEDTGILGKVRGRLAEKRFLKQEAWRGRFRANLRRAGLQMEEEIVPGSKKTIYFIKLHAPWDVLCTWAEELKMKAPLQPLYHLVRDRVTPRKSIGPRYRDGFLDSVTRLRVQDQLRMTSIQMSPKMELFLARIVRPNMPHNWSEWILKKLHIPNIMQQDVPNKPVEYFTCPFKKAKVDKFLGSEDQDHYFSTSQRIRIVYELLATSVFGKRKQGEVGIERLVDEGTYNAAFPLHDGEYEIPKGTDVPPSEMNARQVLYEYWGRYTRWYKYQPLDHIREYFGEKIGIYFAWLGFYTGWLLPAAVVGFLVFLYGLITIDTNDVANEICAKPSQFKMCPLCDYCKYWDLHTICAYAKIAYLFDHPGTVFYSVFVSFWAVTFLEYWKRKCATLAHHWDCMDYQEEEERPRPDFAARAPSYGKNPITGVREPTFPHRVRLKRIAAGVGIIILMMSLVIIFIVAVIIYRVLVSIPLFQNPTFRSQAQAISSLSGAIVNLILIMCMGRVYEKLAYRLTVWEMHRTQSEFEDNLTFKVFVFQFINFYSSIFYIAFFKGRFVGYPGHYNHILGLRNEDCAAGGCLVELAQQLAVIMIGKQMVNNAQEIILPKLKARWQNRQVKAAISTSNKSRWEEDYQLIDSEGLFQEYLEMVLQFGFITIFVAAFPLAPLFALLNNWVEIRLDAQKFLCETRRPVAERCANIGIWFTILETLAHLAVISNAFLIAFTSEFLPKMLYQYEMHWHLEGYVNFTMAYAPNSTDSSVPGDCRYRGFRDENGKFTTFYWRLLAVRLGFVILFEHVVFFCCKMIDLMVPDVPESLSLKMKRERYLAKQALADASAVGTGGGDEEKDDPAEAQQQLSETVVHLAGPDQVERTAL